LQLFPLQEQIMLPLDSPVWNDLECARGSAGHIPALINKVCDPSLVESERKASWTEVWENLCHNDSVYSATYAAVPHLAACVLKGDLSSRLELLLFSGRVLGFGRLVGKPLSVKLVEGFAQVVDKIAAESTAILREAKEQDLLSCYPSTQLIQCTLALNFGCDPVVQLIQSIIDDNLEIEVVCPGCDEPNKVLVDELERANITVETSADDDSVTAGMTLANDLGDASLEKRIATLRSAVKCKSCDVEFSMYDGYV